MPLYKRKGRQGEEAIRPRGFPATGLGGKRGHVRRRVPCLSTLRRAPRPWTPPGGDRVGVRIVLKFIFQLQVTRYYISFSPLFLLWLCGPLWRAKSERRHRAGTFHLRYAHLPHDFVHDLESEVQEGSRGPSAGLGPWKVRSNALPSVSELRDPSGSSRLPPLVPEPVHSRTTLRCPWLPSSGLAQAGGPSSGKCADPHPISF